MHYSATGALNKITFGNGATQRNHARYCRSPVEHARHRPLGFPSNTVWDSGTFEYDGAGNITAIGGQTYVYDVVGRLVEANVLPQATDPDGDANNVRYTYDLYGNMTSRDWGHDGNFAATGTPADFEFFGRQHIETAAPVEDNRIHDTGFAYDANGNMTRYVKDGGGVGSTWTSQNRMSTYYAANPETSGGVVAERYVYDADGYRLVQYPDSPHTGDGVPLLSIRDTAGQLLAQFEHRPLEANPTLKKEFVSGLGQLLVERDVVEAPSSVSTNSALESGGSYGFQVLDNPVASEYTIDIRTHSGIVAQLQNQAPDGGGILWIPSANFADADTNFVRVRKQDGATSYSAPVTLSPDSSVTGSSANQVRAISSARVGANVEIRWDLLQQNGQTTYVHFERADGGGTILLTPMGVPSGVTSLSLLHQALSAPCGTVFTTTSPSSTLNPSVGAETKNFGHLESTAEPSCETPPSPPSGYALIHFFHHRDYVRSLRVVTDEAGAAVAAHDYYPFGRDLGQPSGNSHKRFTGHERDHESTLDYMLARYCGSNLARFLGVDPGRDISLASPQSWDLYTYVGNRPLNLIDPTGKYRRGAKWTNDEWAAFDAAQQEAAKRNREVAAQLTAAAKLLKAGKSNETIEKFRNAFGDGQTTPENMLEVAEKLTQSAVAMEDREGDADEPGAFVADKMSLAEWKANPNFKLPARAAGDQSGNKIYFLHKGPEDELFGTDYHYFIPHESLHNFGLVDQARMGKGPTDGPFVKTFEPLLRLKESEELRTMDNVDTFLWMVLGDE